MRAAWWVRWRKPIDYPLTRAELDRVWNRLYRTLEGGNKHWQ